MDPDVHLAELSRTIQLAVAPVFLLTALGTLLSVLSARLGRIVDRSRVLLERPPLGSKTASVELSGLRRRRRLVNHAITSATVSALLISLVIGVAFLGFILHFDFAGLMAGLFIAAMGALVAALVLFLREVLVAVATSSPIEPEGRGGERRDGTG